MALATTREILTLNEASAKDVALICFNQGVLTGDWNGAHISVMGAYDSATDRVLPSRLLRGPAPKSQDILAVQTGGVVLVSSQLGRARPSGIDGLSAPRHADDSGVA